MFISHSPQRTGRFYVCERSMTTKQVRGPFIFIKIQTVLHADHVSYRSLNFPEDDTEISFEPGDIIMDVETVDKAWWRGFSKDGHHGLFPSNYVETI